jgi:hypothetical protein
MAVGMISRSMIEIQSFVKIGAGVQKLLGGISIQTHIDSKVIHKPTFVVYK